MEETEKQLSYEIAQKLRREKLLTKRILEDKFHIEQILDENRDFVYLIIAVWKRD